MRIDIVSSVGSEYDGSSLVADGTTVGAAIENAIGEKFDSSRMQALVNGTKVSESAVLSDGDRLTIAPTKVTGY